MSGSERRVLINHHDSNNEGVKVDHEDHGVISSEWVLRVISIAVDFQFSVHD